ncbi:integron-associated HEPN domain-containing protein [Alysiella filiformis]|uniref:HEPN-like integron domain-containing protein n=1 Tax=Alysiella filiformis DSM 16848 TaxID=1120981 RepID=A0A286E4C0_9NEIS|nr:integron-associated HEPN domain-containing protein [Alysiella filiformis]QMT30991.1 hypothetical protein H3L97_09715 [Alysiella filiformis]UBQ56021.1 hypothetical protein JF568_10755 [Alysiella filiformis DSM 16848]SOD65746.1 hypothetical protein SAMN02746062_00407 [Alysiella filiformis DSM 16848]
MNEQSVLTKEDKNTLLKMYFYFQYTAIEIQSAVNLLYMLEQFIEGKPYKEMIANEMLVLAPSQGSLNAYVTLSRVAFHNLIINIFKLGELIEKKQGILTHLPEFNKSVNEFRKIFFTQDLRLYRNTYVAHHSDKNKDKSDNFLNYEELIQTFCKIIGVDLSIFNKDIQTFFPFLLKYGENFFSKNPKGTEIHSIVFNSASEFQKVLGVEKLNRKHTFS